ncbi:polysaccharide export protein EpsE [Duganella radicis]|uniref:Polysaccharide export protein EpsE n=1 Tax=Duganella radicis TaxID=551988 RepID=A0A6L6PSV0_9BURK|nr:polysaccharide export protein EpsE [Duganella radicis]MTV41914.1 polysaccharide export protein EpsE [Duganella radicis]
MKRWAKWMVAAMLGMMATLAWAGDVLLGGGDLIKVSVYGSPDLGLETRVAEDGSITFPLVGNVKVGGLPVSAAEQKLAGLLESGGFLRKAQVNIVVTALQSQQVSVLGQVNRPGRYPLDTRRTVLDMLAQAGGIGAEGSDVVVLIRKQGDKPTKQNIDILGMMQSGNVAPDVTVESNDIIFVERAPRFYVYGEVQRPGTFRLERSMTVLQALAAGGGLTQRGTERHIRIKRRDADGKLQVIDAKQDDLLKADDVVYISESWF